MMSWKHRNVVLFRLFLFLKYCCLYNKAYYSAATPTGPGIRKLTNRDANWKQKIAKFFCKQPITLKQADNARSKKIDTVTSDHDPLGNCHVYD